MKEQVNELSAQIRAKFGSISRFASRLNIPVESVYKSFARMRMNSGKYVTGFDSREELKRWITLYKQTKP